MAKAEVVIANNVEVITTIIRTWINNIILINKEDKETSSKEVRCKWEASLNHQCKTKDKLIHSKWTCSNSSQEHHNKFRWINNLSNCHRSTSPHLNPWLVNKPLSSLETASMDLFNKPSEKSLLQELLVCSLMRTPELISRSFWQTTNTLLAKSMKPINSFWALSRDETAFSHFWCDWVMTVQEGVSRPTWIVYKTIENG